MRIELKKYRFLNGSCLRVLYKPTVQQMLRIYSFFVRAPERKVVLDKHGEDLLAALLIHINFCVEFQFESLLLICFVGDCELVT